MFRITSKVKIAAGIAAGALALGAAGAYAANANNTVPVVTTSTTLTGSNGATITLSTVSTSPKAFPSTAFKNEGQCIAWFASNRDFAPQTTSSTVSKNFHGKLMSSSTIRSFCAKDVTASTKTDSTETPDATESAAPETDSTDSTDTQSGALHGHGHGHGHNPTA